MRMSRCRLAGLLWWFWLDHGHLAEGREWLARALALDSADPKRRVRALNAAAHLAFWQTDYEGCGAALDAQLALADGLDDSRWSRAWVALGRSALVTIQGDLDRALELSETSIELFRELGVTWEISYALTCGAMPAWFQGDYAHVMRNASDALAILRRSGSRSVLAQVLYMHSIAVAATGDSARAIAFGEESLAIANEQRNRVHAAYALNVLGSIARKSADHEQAVARHTAALTVAVDLGDFWATLWALDGIATCLSAQGRHDIAARLLAAVESLQRATGHRHAPLERELHVRDVDRVRRHLSAARLRAHSSAGEKLDLEDAIALARTAF